MNTLSQDKKIQVLNALVEGCSIRSIERMTGIHHDTIMRLGVTVGELCSKLLDEKLVYYGRPPGSAGEAVRV